MPVAVFHLQQEQGATHVRVTDAVVLSADMLVTSIFMAGLLELCCTQSPERSFSSTGALEVFLQGPKGYMGDAVEVGVFGL